MRKRTMNKLTMKKVKSGKGGKSGKVRKHLTTVRRNVEERRCGRGCGKGGRGGKSGRWGGHQVRKRTMNKLTMKKVKSGKGGKSEKVRKHLTTVRRNVEERRC